MKKLLELSKTNLLLDSDNLPVTFEKSEEDNTITLQYLNNDGLEIPSSDLEVDYKNISEEIKKMVDSSNGLSAEQAIGKILGTDRVHEEPRNYPLVWQSIFPPPKKTTYYYTIGL